MTEMMKTFYSSYLELLLYEPPNEKGTTFQWDSNIKNVGGNNPGRRARLRPCPKRCCPPLCGSSFVKLVLGW